MPLFGPSRVQSNSVASAGTVTSQALTLATGVTLGNLVTVVFCIGATPVTPTAPDGSWLQAVVNTPASGQAAVVAIYCLVVDSGHAGLASFTFTISSSHTVYGTIAEWSSTNGWPTNPIDQTAVGNLDNPPLAVTHIHSGLFSTTTQKSELWVAGLAYKGSPQTESNLSAGWTNGPEPFNSGNTTLREVYQIVYGTGADDPGFDLATAEGWGGAVATFKDGASAIPYWIQDSGVGDDSGISIVGSSTVTITETGHATDSITAVDVNAIPITITETGVGVDTIGEDLFAGVGGAGQAPPVQGVPSPGPPGVPQAERYVASWSIRLLNPSRQVVGALTGFRKFAIVERFNTFSDWSIELDASDPQVANLLTPGYGLSASRTVRDLKTGQAVSNRVEVAGPTRKIGRTFNADTLTISGKDWLFYLQSERALPVTSYPYDGDALALPGISRYYRLNETAGTTATDSKGTTNGTYTGGFSLNQGALLDDPDSFPSFNGSTGYVSIPTTSMATGNATMWEGCWFKINGLPTGALLGMIMQYGDGATTKANFDFYLNSSGQLKSGLFNSDTAALATLTTGSLHFVLITWDGTNLVTYLDGVQINSTSGLGPLAIAATGTLLTLAHQNNAGTPAWFNGVIGKAMYGSGTLPTAAQIAALYKTGLSRFGHGTGYDTFTGNAESAIKHYVSANIGPAAGFTERQVAGLAVPASANQGSTVTGNARWDYMLAPDGSGLLQQLALTGGVGLSLKIVSGVLTFDVFTPVDRTANVIFATNLGNVLDYSWERSAPDPATGGNVVYVAGGNQLTDRVIVTRTDPTSITTWGRTEHFLDARDTVDVPTLQQRGDAVLASSKETQQFSLVLQPGAGMVYGVHYNLGDKVSAVIDGQEFKELIREIDITLDANATEVITPVLGTPNAVLVQDASIALHRRLAERVNTLSSLQNRT